jgi:hypothetical protein
MKRARLEDDNNVAVCSICLDALHSTGKHRSVVLKCGHVFGKKCISAWLVEKKRKAECPQCKEPSAKKDLRDVFLPVGSLLDAAEVNRLKVNDVFSCLCLSLVSVSDL